jgi:glycerol-3-phosphate cytidylyltransferase
MIIGFTAGVYDMFHIGHLNLLRQAREHCDYLIVAVSTDEYSVKYKNKAPIIPFAERAAIVESIRYVDKVIPQNESSDKWDAQKKFGYNVIFVGDDWKGQPNWIEMEKKMAEIGGKVVYFPYTKHVSSSIIREKLVKDNL